MGVSHHIGWEVGAQGRGTFCDKVKRAHALYQVVCIRFQWCTSFMTVAKRKSLNRLNAF